MEKHNFASMITPLIAADGEPFVGLTERFFKKVHKERCGYPIRSGLWHGSHHAVSSTPLDWRAK